MDSGEEVAVGGSLGQTNSVHPSRLGAAGQSEALGWQAEGTFLTQSSRSSGRCQVPKCANLGSPSLPQNLLLVDRWVREELKSNKEAAPTAEMRSNQVVIPLVVTYRRCVPAVGSVTSNDRK